MIFEIKKITPNVRKKIKGDFIKLTNGFVHYEIKGNKNQDVIILVHGFCSWSFVWEKNFHVLADNGFKVIRFDLFGRGFSDRPNTTYDINLFVNQLYDLVLKLVDHNKKIHLIGSSMGGLISLVFASLYPTLINKISLIDPAGLPSETINVPLVVKIPIINKLVFKLIGNYMVLKGLSKSVYSQDFVKGLTREFKKQMIYTGYQHAILSTLININMEGFENTYKKVASLNLPVQLIWGQKDEVISYNTSKTARKLLPNARFHSIKDAGHMPNYEKPDEVNKLLVDFLKKPT